MKLIGRILLLVACGFMGYAAVTTCIGCLDALKAHDWWHFDSFGEMFSVLGSFLMQIVVLLFVVIGIIAALRGRASLKFALISIILFVNIVFSFVNGLRGGAVDFLTILNITLTCLYPILYVTGGFLLCFD